VRDSAARAKEPEGKAFAQLSGLEISVRDLESRALPSSTSREKRPPGQACGHLRRLPRCDTFLLYSLCDPFDYL
jgi:hypothetical protein